MLAEITGTVMEIKREYDKQKNELSTVTAMIWQKGERNLIPVKKIPEKILEEGKEITTLPVSVFSYYYNGKHGLSTFYRPA